MLLFILSLLLFWVTYPADAYAQKVRTSYPGTAGVNVPFWLTHQAGLFKKYGLDHEALLISGSVTTMQALLAGEIQFVNSSGAPAINARLQGADITIVASYYDFMPYGLVVGKDVKSMEDLRGKRMAVASLGGINEAAIRFAFERQHLNSKERHIYPGWRRSIENRRRGIGIGGRDSACTTRSFRCHQAGTEYAGGSW